MFNPEGITQFNTIPGIMGSILSTTLILMTALSITRERENGALENLLVSPLSGLEVIIGKITPFVIIGLFQATLILIAAVLLFDIPLHGSVFLLFFVLLIYLCLSLSVNWYRYFWLSTKPAAGAANVVILFHPFTYAVRICQPLY